VEVNGRLAPIFSVNPTQISIQVPPELSANELMVFRVSRPGLYEASQTSERLVVHAVELAPGILSWPVAHGEPQTESSASSAANVYAKIRNAEGKDLNLNDPYLTNTIILSLTGLGQTIPTVGSGRGGPAEEPFARTEFNIPGSNLQ
jgi:uncharacterized protein (TIGR03437 family)